MPMTLFGNAPARIASVSEPVPHPTSSQSPCSGTASQRTKFGVSIRLQRPMYRSYGTALLKTSGWCISRPVYEVGEAALFGADRNAPAWFAAQRANERG